MKKVISHKLVEGFEQFEAQKYGEVLIELEVEKYRGQPQRLRVKMNERLFRAHGLEPILEQNGLKMKTGRIPVLRNGEKIGSLLASVSPDFIRSTSWFYGPLKGDLKRVDDHFEIDPMLGDGDIDSIVGFVWERYE